MVAGRNARIRTIHLAAHHDYIHLTASTRVVVVVAVVVCDTADGVAVAVVDCVVVEVARAVDARTIRSVHVATSMAAAVDRRRVILFDWIWLQQLGLLLILLVFSDPAYAIGNLL